MVPEAAGVHDGGDPGRGGLQVREDAAAQEKHLGVGRPATEGRRDGGEEVLVADGQPSVQLLEVEEDGEAADRGGDGVEAAIGSRDRVARVSVARGGGEGLRVDGKEPVEVDIRHEAAGDLGPVLGGLDDGAPPELLLRELMEKPLPDGHGLVEV